MQEEQKEWFESWFDSPYHKILYKNRDTKEAKGLVDNLFRFLEIKPGCKILDIACGDGRHAQYMQAQGHEVIGIDLSEERINRAKELSNEQLSFYRHDMRHIFRLNYFDYAFNFFTSFGYFQQYRDNIIAAEAFAKSLKPGGKLVIDYMNISVVKEKLVSTEILHTEGVTFDLKRSFEDGKVVKEIRFTDDQGKARKYEERVSGFELEDFKEIFKTSGLTMTQVFGDYNLGAFDQAVSPRLIMVFEK
ncbi:SAM-dependent methyltransferase [Taibaiella sp. KBW10]|uniref:class I SAM-dependent methyltransferase n=1 Tax=Taibaiella sp. KBW10 TaxID=2153357 RepID=UPI000F594722|nr:class I SAM-dependent methyltransferase [Taibaiella sp. KBW10]RQO32601.1 SAM-dependent methyltransferase [Taibaiella sp. KBW10]